MASNHPLAEPVSMSVLIVPVTEVNAVVVSVVAFEKDIGVAPVTFANPWAGILAVFVAIEDREVFPVVCSAEVEAPVGSAMT